MKFFIQSIHVLGDIFTQIRPTRDAPGTYKFAFLVHPRSTKDIRRKFPFFKYVPNYFASLFTKYFPPITLSRITGLRSLKDGKEIDGYVISILLTAHQMIENKALALKRIVQACKFAQKKGVKIIGLGGLTSSLSKGGLDLLSHIDVNVTTGHAYTSYNVTQNVLSVIDYMDIKKESILIAIVGAAGSIGTTTTRLLARSGFKNFILIDIERKLDRCNDLVTELIKTTENVNTRLSHQIGDIHNADIVIAATNAPEALIRSKDLKWGAIVIDDAQPSDVHEDVFSREDVLVIEAGVTYTPGINSNFNFGLKDREDNFCCLAEVLILAAHEWDKHYVINRASLNLVDEIVNLGSRLNFKIGKFQNFNELISSDKLVYVKKCIKQNEH